MAGYEALIGHNYERISSLYDLLDLPFGCHRYQRPRRRVSGGSPAGFSLRA